MYDTDISGATPMCVVFLLDRSDSMNRPWAGSDATMAEGAARAVNRALFNLGAQARKNGRFRHYFDIAVLGYGLRTSDGKEGVETALGGAFAGAGLVPVDELMARPVREEAVPSPDRGGAVTPRPVWVDPVHGLKTPMCEAIATAGGYVKQWTATHRDSFPPVVFNITDGLVTDSPYRNATLEEWASRLPTLSTENGATLLFNIFLAPTAEQPCEFPTSASGLPAPGPQLFGMSSVLPAAMVQTARKQGLQLQPGARAFCFNANETSLDTFLTVGTRPNLQQVG